MAMDHIQISILDDGTIKVETDQISMPNHANAEEFIRLMAEMANGGSQTREHKAHSHNHGHHHNHAHLGEGD